MANSGMSGCRFSYSLEGKTVFVAGHKGMVGSALLRRLEGERCDILTVSRDDLDLCEQSAVYDWMMRHTPDVIVLAAARVGGISANAAYPAMFFHENMMMTSNVVHSAYQAGVERLLYLGSSCIYPREALQPVTEDSLLSGRLEPTNEAYALAKICGVKMTQFYRAQYGCDFISAMPCNLFGVGDTYDIENSHVIPAMIMKIHAAKLAAEDFLYLWGTGKPLREFLYVDHLADDLVFLLEHYNDATPINLGSGFEISIRNLAHTVADVLGFKGKILFDEAKPDGVMRKVLDNRRIESLHSEYKMCRKCGHMDLDVFKALVSRAYEDFLARHDGGNRRDGRNNAGWSAG